MRRVYPGGSGYSHHDSFEHRLAESLLDTVLVSKFGHLGYRPQVSTSCYGDISMGGSSGLCGHHQPFEMRLNNKLLDAVMVAELGPSGRSMIDDVNDDAPFEERLTGRLMNVLLEHKFGHLRHVGDNPAQDPDLHFGMSKRYMEVLTPIEMLEVKKVIKIYLQLLKLLKLEL